MKPDLTPQEHWFRSQLDHPAGRDYNPGKHRPAPGRPTVGNLDESRDEAPAPSIIDGITLIVLLALAVLFTAALIVAQLWHALGWFGAGIGVLIVASVAWIIRERTTR